MLPQSRIFDVWPVVLVCESIILFESTTWYICTEIAPGLVNYTLYQYILVRQRNAIRTRREDEKADKGPGGGKWMT
jgi:hypothetical protein